jgi:4-hydroxybenzoate polyprenyltransferase
MDKTLDYGVWLRYHQLLRLERHYKSWAIRWGALILTAYALSATLNSKPLSFALLPVIASFSYMMGTNILRCVRARREADKAIGF